MSGGAVSSRAGRRQAIADARMLSPENVAALGTDQTLAENRMRAIFRRSLLDQDDEAEKEITMMMLATVWRCAGQVAQVSATRRVRMEENPHCVPDLPEETYLLMLESFAEAHPQDFGLDHDTPHTRFIARITRDLAVDGILPNYELGWVRLKSETVTTVPGWGKTPDDLVKMQRAEQPAIVLGEEDVRNRIFAYYKALEFTGVLSYSTAKVVWNDNRMITSAEGGGFDFIKEMTAQAREYPGMRFIFEVDRLFRKAVHTLQTTKRKEGFTSYAIAHNYVMREMKEIWAEAKELARRGGGGGGGSGGGASSSGGGNGGDQGQSGNKRNGGKKQRTPEEQARVAKLQAEELANRQAKEKRRAEHEAHNQAKFAKTSGGGGNGRGRNGGGGGKGGGRGGGRGRGRGGFSTEETGEDRVAVMKQQKPHPLMPGTCMFWNVHTCKAKKCNFKHICWVCGKNHTWADNHA